MKSKHMKHRTKFALLAAFLIPSCAPLQIYYKEGETVARMDRDQSACEIQALSQVPTDLRTRYVPPTYAPYQVCSGTGHCYWHQRIISPGRYEKYDANLGLREKVTSQCMADKGYALTNIKQCDTATTRATRLQATQVLPPISENSCAVRLKSGRWQIINPSEG